MYPECILDDLLAVFTGGYFGTAEPLDRSTADLTFHRTGWMTRLHRAQPRTEAEGAPGAHAGLLSPRAIHPRHRPLRLGPQPALRPPRRRLLPAPPRPRTTCHTYGGPVGVDVPKIDLPKIALPPLKLD